MARAFSKRDGAVFRRRVGGGGGAAAPIVLIEDGHNDYRIVVAAGASAATRHAAEELQQYLRRVLPARFNRDYAYVEHFRRQPDSRFAYEGPARLGKIRAVAPEFKRRAARLLEQMEMLRVAHIREGEPDAEAYAAGWVPFCQRPISLRHKLTFQGLDESHARVSKPWKAPAARISGPRGRRRRS